MTNDQGPRARDQGPRTRDPGELLAEKLKFSQAFPLNFCLLQVIKNWKQERPGNEANVLVDVQVYMPS